ncbi:MAG: hypothetical protein H6608_04115 [Flavobacteriales bacterium]|nr:hypothetical protein [Flavobacteriales bacterium]
MGSYISHGKKNYKLPKNVEPKDLSYEEVLEIIKNQPTKTKTTKSRKKKA